MTREGSAPLAETAQQVQGVAREPGHEMARPDNGAIGQTQAREQSAEKAALEACNEALRNLSPKAAKDVDFGALVRHFADVAHQSRTDTLREAAKVAEAVANRPVQGPEHDVWHRAERQTAKRLAAAILALIDLPATDEKPTTGVEATIPSSDMADILETIENAADDWRAQGYTSALAEVRDMANVGRALIERIREVVASPGPMHGWAPADDPAEIVIDMANMLADAPTTTLPEAAEVERLWELLGTRSRPDLDPNLTAAVFRWARKSGNFPGYRSQDGRIAAEAFNALPHLLASLRPTSQEAEGREAES
jgi:hypothetical protein